MRKIIQILLFIISYAPLYFILFFQNLNDKFYDDKNIFIGWNQILKQNQVSLSFFILIVLSITLYFILYKIIIQSATEKIKIGKIHDSYDDHLSYLAAYILPFVGLKFDNWQNILSTLALFYVLGNIYIKTNLILTNPTLTFFGFSISKINNESENSIIVIHKKALKQDSEMNFINLINNIYILK